LAVENFQEIGCDARYAGLVEHRGQRLRLRNPPKRPGLRTRRFKSALVGQHDFKPIEIGSDGVD